MPEHTHTSPNHCLNCGAPLPAGAGWCCYCGQKVPKQLVPTLRELLLDGIETLFNLDHRIWRTLWALFRPGALTLAWLEGKRARYYPPFRIFFVSALVFFALNALLQPADVGVVQVSGATPAQIRQQRARYYLLDSLRRNAEAWSPAAPDQARQVLDTLLARMPSPCGDSTTFTTLDGRSLRFCKNDLFALSPAEFFDRYEVRDFWSRLSLTLLLKSIQSSDSLNQLLLHYFVWFLAALLPLLAAVSQLVFRKARRRYVVHLVRLLHFAAFAFVLLTLAQLLTLARLPATPIDTLTVLALPAWDLLAAKRCLGLSWRATLWRWLLFGLLATIAFSIGLVAYAALGVILL